MNKNKNLKGSMLAYIIVIMVVVLIILVSIIQYIVSQINYGHYEASREEAFQIAETGVNYYRWYLSHQVEGRTTQQMRDFWENGEPIGVETSYEAEFSDPSGSALGRYRLEVTPPPENSTIVTVKSTAWTYRYPEIQRTIQVRLRRPAWSEYIVLGEENLRFGSGTEIEGKIFCNGGVHFDGVAHNLVSSAVASYYDSDHDIRATKPGVWTSWPDEYNDDMSSDVFLAGKRMQASPKDFTSISGDLSYIKQEAQSPNGTNTEGCTSSGCYFDNRHQGRHIILSADGTFRIRTVRSFNGSSNSIINYDGSWQTYNIPDDGAIYVEENVWLEGTINNKSVTIVAANLISSSKPKVFIEHDIRYTNYDGSDVLGIISQDDVEIIESSENDLKIDAAIIAQEGRIGREHYSNHDHKDTITVYGALATRERYGFSWTDGTGYETRNLEYDNNLLYNPPPYFPTGNQYLMDLWEEL